MRVADRPAHRRRRGERRLSPVVPALLIAAVLLADGAVVLRQSYAGAAELAAAPAAGPAAGPMREPAPRPTAAESPSTEVARATGPLRLAVPALGVDATAVELGTAADGTLEVPATAQGVGWYTGSALPGDVGPAVFAGHVDLDGEAGVFGRLGGLAPGDPIAVHRPDGAVVEFVVSRVEQHAKDAFPTERVYGPTTAPELRLVTCGGSFDRRRGSYRDNVVVFAELPGSTPG